MTTSCALAGAAQVAAQARATLTQTEENYRRVEGLVAQKVSAQKSLEDAIAARDQARAAIQSTQADVQTATLNVEYTVIKAPVTGPTVGMPLDSTSGRMDAVLAVPRGEISANIDCASTISVTFLSVRAAT